MDTVSHPDSPASAAPELDKVLTGEEVEQVFRLILGRPTGDPAYVRATATRRITAAHYARELVGSFEFKQGFLNRIGYSGERMGLGDPGYRVPTALSRPAKQRMGIMLIGSCLMDDWPDVLTDCAAGQGIDLTVERLPFNNASPLPTLTTAEAAGFDFAIVQLPLRSVLREAAFFGLRADDLEGHQAVFREACGLMRLNLEQALSYHRAHGLRCYLVNFLVPQQNPTGRMLPRYSLCNMVHMVEELNRHLWELCEGMPGVQLVDLDAISATIGRRYVQDDSVSHSNHGGLLGPVGLWHDAQRVEPLGEVDQIYTRRTIPFIRTVFQEVLAMHRTLLLQDSVKIVLFDLDDTLWRGVAAEQERIGPKMIEGWPLGVLEAVAQLWRRGVLVALVSKNDEEVVLDVWKRLYQGLFPIENFVARRIDWAPKAQNIREILEAVNLLPENAVFVDDNPLERAAVREALPGLRVIEAPTVEWRRILLWSAETQRAEVNREALARTGMVQAQMRREEERATLDPTAFLAELDLRVELGAVASEKDPAFGRCFELLNKTNQYNTTGQRWSPGDMRRLLAEGGCLLHVAVRDRHTPYGIVAVAVIRGNMIEQVVMSCRVFGMGVEQVLLGTALASIRNWRNGGAVRAWLRQTGRNRLCQELFAANGFVRLDEESWEAPEALVLHLPAHIRLGLD